MHTSTVVCEITILMLKVIAKTSHIEVFATDNISEKLRNK